MSVRRRRNALAPAVRATVAALESRLLLAEVAGELFVDIDATQLPEGPVTNIPNSGTMTGSFDPTGGGDTIPVIDQPLAASAVGTKGIRLDGNDYLQLALDGGLLPAPEGLVGADPTRTVEAWVWNPGVQGEETMVSWSRRGGPDGTNVSFNYGSSGAFGAVGHWGAPDIGWGAGLVPAARHWHHLVYTYDGPTFTTRVYVDGVQTNTEVLTAGAINTPAGFPINLGTQMEPTNIPTVAGRGTLTLGKVRIHDGVLTPEQVLLNFDAEKAGFIEPDDIPVPPPPAVVQVDINPTTIGDGPVTSIPNAGPAGGFFAATGGGDQTPVIALPLPTATSGTRGLRLDGNDFLRHVQDATATPPVDQAPPTSLVGADPRTSMDAWVWNPNVTGEETMLAWGRRGGPDGTNMSFNYGSSGAFGAVGHWGAPDIGWGTVPAAQHWHHLVHTFDGTTTRVYVDGVQTNTEVIGEGALNTPATPPINIGAQNTAAGVPDAGLRGSLTLGRMRIYSGVLTPEQITATFDAEKGGYVEPGIPPPPDPVALTAPPVHRYSFNAPAGDATAGVIEDSIGDADGVVKGPGATWNGSRLVLPGGPSATAPYGDLPNNLISLMGADTGAPGLVTLEGWARNTGTQNWSRFFDFGASGALEIEQPGGTGNGTTYLMLSAQVGGDTALHRFELLNFAGSTVNRTVDVGSPTFNTDVHFAVTWDDNTGDVKLYENGVEVAAFNSPFRMAQMIDVNNWLGRSNYNADNNLQGEFDEFRIYDHVLTPGEVRGNFQAGANVVTSPGTPVSEVYVKGASWLGQDNVPATVNFMEYLENKGLGDDVLGYRLFGTGRTPPAGNPEDIIPWINADQIVLRYAQAPTGSGVPTPGNLTVTGRNQAVSSYTVTSVTPVAGDPTAFVLQLNKPLGGGNPDTGVAPSFDENGDYVTISVPGAGAAGSTFRLRMSVLQGDTDHLDETSSTHAVLARDFAEVKKRFFKDTTSAVVGDGADYTAFHDVDGSGSILARDFAEVKKRFFQSLPPPPAAAAAALGGASITSDLFGTSRIL